MRLIDADEVARCFDSNTWQGEMMIGLAKAIPSVDPVHAAGACYCRECNSYIKSGNYVDENGEEKEFWYCDLHSGNNWAVQMQPNDFCNYGQRKETEEKK